MAIGSTAVWEVRTTGNDANGGFYTSGGTDYSQQDSAQLSVTDGVTNGTTTVTSATGGFTSAMIGNGINIAGTLYQITARASSTSITVDRNTGTGTGQTMKVGGALVSPKKAIDNAVSGNAIYVKKGASAYHFSAGIAPTVDIPPAGNQGVYVIGYDATRGDNGTPTLFADTSTSFCDIGVNGWYFYNLIIDCNNTAPYGIRMTGSYQGSCRNVHVRRWTAQAIAIGQWSFFCSAIGGTSTATAGFSGGNQYACVVAETAGASGFLGFNSNTWNCIAANLTGTSNHGFGVGWNYGKIAIGNTAYNVTGSGMYDDPSYDIGIMIGRNIIYSVGNYGIRRNYDSARSPGWVFANAIGSATSGNYLSGTNANDVALSANPFANAGTVADWADAFSRFALNTTAGGGAACRAAGLPAYLDFGAVQHQDAGGSTIIIVEDD